MSEPSTINWQSRDAAIEREKALLDAAHPSDGWGYRLERIFIRATRIVFGLVLLIVALMIWGNTPSVSDTPFAALTFRDLAGNVFGIMCTLLFVYWAYLAAFGAAPNVSERHRGKAILNVDTRARNNGGRY